RCALAEVYRDQGRLDDAEREFRAALAEQPDLTPAWLCIGDMWLRAGQLRKVDELCAQLQANPKTALDCALLKARSLIMQNKFPESRELFQQTIARAPKNAWPRELLAHCLLLENRDAPALVEALKQVLILDPTNNFALANLAAAQQKLSGSK